jgi:hypothetical protein
MPYLTEGSPPILHSYPAEGSVKAYGYCWSSASVSPMGC